MRWDLGRLVNLDKNRFVGQAALIAEHERGPAREIVGLEIDWPQVEGFTLASRRRFRQWRRACTCRFIKKVFRLESDDEHVVADVEENDRTRNHQSRLHAAGNEVAIRDHGRSRRHHVRATVVKTPFFNPKRKTATPVV